MSASAVDKSAMISTSAVDKSVAKSTCAVEISAIAAAIELRLLTAKTGEEVSEDLSIPVGMSM